MHIHCEARLTDAPAHGTRVPKDAISKPLALDLETKRMLALQMATEQHVAHPRKDPWSSNDEHLGPCRAVSCAALCRATLCGEAELQTNNLRVQW